MTIYWNIHTNHFIFDYMTETVYSCVVDKMCKCSMEKNESQLNWIEFWIVKGGTETLTETETEEDDLRWENSLNCVRMHISKTK